MEKYTIKYLKAEQVASITDYIFLKTEDAFIKDPLGAVAAREKAFKEFLSQVVIFNPYAACVRHFDVSKMKEALDNNHRDDIKIAAAVGFPYPDIFSRNSSQLQITINEIDIAYQCGAREIDFVLPRNKFSPNGSIIKNYVESVNNSIKNKGMLSKLILEIGELDEKEIISAFIFADNLRIDFLKTSTGYAKNPTPNLVHFVKKNFHRGINISGGVNLDNYQEFLSAANNYQGEIELDPLKIRLGASGLLSQLYQKGNNDTY